MLVGAALLLGGLVMLVTPGPGIVLIIAGLAVLATEFVWAERMLDKAKARAAAATDKVRRRRRSGATGTDATRRPSEALASGPPEVPPVPPADATTAGEA